MINTIISIFMVTSSLAVLFTKNPVKLSLMLILISSSIFIFINAKTGMCWFPILFTMLFLGGILMMFMILSAVLPNEKVKKNKMILMFILILSMLSVSSSTPVQMLALSLKSFLSSSLTMYFMMVLILLYFFVFISMLSKEETSMRSSWCYLKNNFVNCWEKSSNIYCSKSSKTK